MSTNAYLVGQKLFPAVETDFCSLCDAVIYEGDPVRCLYLRLGNKKASCEASQLVCEKHPTSPD